MTSRRVARFQVSSFCDFLIALFNGFEILFSLPRRFFGLNNRAFPVSLRSSYPESMEMRRTEPSRLNVRDSNLERLDLSGSRHAGLPQFKKKAYFGLLLERAADSS